MRVWDGMYVVCHQIPRCVMKFKTSYKGFMYVNFSLCIPWVDTCNYHWMVKIILNMRDLGNRMQNQLAPRLAKSTSTGKKSWIEIVFKLYYNASGVLWVFRGVISAQCHKQHFSEYCKGSINTLQGMSIWRDKVLGLNLFSYWCWSRNLQQWWLLTKHGNYWCHHFGHMTGVYITGQKNVFNIFNKCEK